MPGVVPYWVEAEVKILIKHAGEAYVRTSAGCVYLITAGLPGLDFDKLSVGIRVKIEVTDRLDRVYSAKVVTDAAEEDGNPPVS